MKIEKNDIEKFAKKIIPFLKKTAQILKKCVLATLRYLKKSWRSVVVFVPSFLVIYYVFGALLSHKIDTDLSFGESKQTKGYQAIQTAADLIARETDKHLYTPNLPFVFPAYVLDNMPAFQKGIFKSVSAVVSKVAQSYNESSIQKAKELLDYAPDVWLFSKTKDFKIAPSSVAQYRKARRKLIEFNEQAAPTALVAQNIKMLIIDDFADISDFLDEKIKTTSAFKADDVFYEAYGRLYADYLFLKPFKTESAPQIGIVLEMLEKALSLEPMIVQNGALGHAFKANHLLELSHFALKSYVLLSSGENRILADVD